MNDSTTSNTIGYKINKPTDLKIYPVSPPQKRLWFNDLLNAESEAYNLHRIYKVKGNLKIDLLEQSINILFSKQKSFFTIFREKAGKLFQVVLPPNYIKLQVTDLTDMTFEQVVDPSSLVLNEIISTQFDISKWPIFRIRLLRLKNNISLFCFVQHHIISDWWSIGLTFGQLSEIYNTLESGREFEYPELKLQYCDFSIKRDMELSNGIYGEQLDFWKNKLRHSSDFNFPYDYKRLENSKRIGQLVNKEVPSEITRAINSICKEENVSLYVFLLSAFGAYINKLTGSRKINIGLPIANRNNSDLEDIIGFFVNIIVAQVNVMENASFAECLRSVRKEMYKGYDNQDIPFDKIVEAINPSRNNNKNPLFQVFFNMLNKNDNAFSLNNLEIERINYEVNIKSYFDFTIYITDKTDTILLTCLYDTDLMKRSTVEKMLDQYVFILSQISQNVNGQISGLTLRSEEDYQLLPDPTKNIDPSLGGYNLLDRVFENKGLNIALVFNNQEWDYNAIDEVCNKMVSCFKSSGIKQGDHVAIYATRSAVSVIAVLAVLKFECVFCIIDLSEQPVDKIVEQIDWSNPQSAIYIETSDNGNATKWEELKQKTAINIELPESKDELTSFLQEYKYENHPNINKPDSESYILFTSGTTGKPKAVVGTMRPIACFISRHIKSFDLNNKYNYALLSGLTHDPLIRDIFVPLCVGATLYIPDNDLLRSLKLAEWLENYNINTINITPALISVLTNDTEHAIKCVKHIFCGGDILSIDMVKKLKTKFPDANIINCYGATETPQIISYFTITDALYEDFEKNKIGKILIGSETESTQLILVNNNKLAGVGEIGEICVRSPYLSKGYLKQKHETKERYITNVFTGNSNDIIYKTGDLGRYTVDGNIEFIGRADSQVKIRGYRFDIKEIEYILKQHTFIESAVAIIKSESGNDDKKIVAYYVSDRNISSLEIKGFLRRKLPEYMIPSSLFRIDSIPVNRNGKINYAELKKQEGTNNKAISKMYPRTDFEKQIAYYWMQSIGLKNVSLVDNFFDIGGHSLKALEVISTIKSNFDIEIVFRDFINNNLGQFCKMCEEKLSMR